MAGRVEGERGVPEDLRAQTYELFCHAGLPTDSERRGFESFGFDFFDVLPITLPQVIKEDKKYFWQADLLFVNDIPDLRDYAVPEAMLVAVKPDDLYIPDSFDKDRPEQLIITQEHSVSQIQSISSRARAVMLPATAVFQIDRAYHADTGELLFKERFGRVLDSIGKYSAYVGRDTPDDPLYVLGRNIPSKDPRVGAVCAVIFIQ